MYEMYGFIAAFTAQILIFSVLGPLRLVGGLRGQIKQFIAEREPAIDPLIAARVDRRLQGLCSMGLATAVIGLLLLVVMIRYMQRPDWTDGPLEAVVPFYFLVQGLPTLLAFMTASRFHAVLKHSLPPERRKALLQPRGLFDFVSRSAVAMAALAYFLFVAFLFYIERHPFPGFAGALVDILGITVVYALLALAIYVTLRTMGSSPLQAREDRMRSVGLAVRICVYTCFVTVASMSLTMTLTLLDQQRWEPTFVSISIVANGLLYRMALKEQTRIPARSSPATTAFTR